MYLWLCPAELKKVSIMGDNHKTNVMDNRKFLDLLDEAFHLFRLLESLLWLILSINT